MNERMNEWMNERMNEWMNEWMIEGCECNGINILEWDNKGMSEYSYRLRWMKWWWWSLTVFSKPSLESVSTFHGVSYTHKHKTQINKY